jgi:hypothetical protein
MFMLAVCSPLAFGCTESPERMETQEIIENLVQAGSPADDIMVVDDAVYIGRDAVVSLAASREMLEPPGTSEEPYRTTNLINTSLTKICVNAPGFTGVFSTALDLAIQNYDERPLTFAMARAPSSGCSFTINAVIDPSMNGGSAELWEELSVAIDALEDPGPECGPVIGWHGVAERRRLPAAVELGCERPPRGAPREHPCCGRAQPVGVTR